MGAWADIDEKTDALHDKIEGHAEELVTDRVSGQFDTGDITAKRVTAAKSVVRRHILRNQTLVDHLDRYSGPEAMLDALAADDSLSDQVLEAIALAFLHVLESPNRITSDGIGQQFTSDFEEDVEQEIEALAGSAPFVLGWTSESGTGFGGGVTNSYDRYD